VLVYVDGDLTVRTRNGHNVTASVPELAPMVAAFADGPSRARNFSEVEDGCRCAGWSDSPQLRFIASPIVTNEHWSPDD
jgi:hypothetical protein